MIGIIYLFLEAGDPGLQSPSPPPTKTTKRAATRDRRPLTGRAFTARTCGVRHSLKMLLFVLLFPGALKQGTGTGCGGQKAAVHGSRAGVVIRSNHG